MAQRKDSCPYYLPPGTSSKEGILKRKEKKFCVQKDVPGCGGRCVICKMRHVSPSKSQCQAEAQELWPPTHGPHLPFPVSAQEDRLSLPRPGASS